MYLAPPPGVHAHHKDSNRSILSIERSRAIVRLGKSPSTQPNPARCRTLPAESVPIYPRAAPCPSATHHRGGRYILQPLWFSDRDGFERTEYYLACHGCCHLHLFTACLPWLSRSFSFYPPPHHRFLRTYICPGLCVKSACMLCQQVAEAGRDLAHD